MNRGETPAVVAFFVLSTLACAPVWAVDYFITQDGPAHAYSASLMLRLLDGDTPVTEVFRLNPWTVSNSIGHWLLVLLLTAVSPFTATKIMVTLTCAGVVAAVGFLRFAAAGRDGILTSLMFGAVLGFNWFWLGGLYNFLLGAIGMAVTLALSLRWRDHLNAGRALGLSALLTLVYISHIVTFGILVMALTLVTALTAPPARRQTCLGLLAA